MTILQNRLVTPDGKPIVGRRITATLMATPSWVGASTEQGRALGSVVTYTMAPDPAETPNPGGLWQLELIPADEYDDEVERRIWYQVDEGDGMLWAVTFDSTDGPEVWLKDHLIDPPKPQPAHPIISRLGDLHDVAADSLATAPDGAVLIKRGGQWVAEVPTFGARDLADLDDVDTSSVSTAVVGDTLEYLGDGVGWGVTNSSPDVALDGTFSDPGAEASPDGMTVRLTLTQRDPERNVVVDWGDSSTSTLTPDQQTADHTYAWGDTYDVWAYYEGDPSGGLSDMVDIPYPRARNA